MAISVMSFSFSRAAQPGGPRAPSAGWWLSLTHLVSYTSGPQLNDFLYSPSYIIVQSPTQSLEWHVWSSSSGNNCHAVHRSLSSSASVYECTMGFYLVPFFQPSPPTRFLFLTAIGMCHFLPVHHFGMACLTRSKVNIQHYASVILSDSEVVIPQRKEGYNSLSLSLLCFVHRQCCIIEEVCCQIFLSFKLLGVFPRDLQLLCF